MFFQIYVLKKKKNMIIMNKISISFVPICISILSFELNVLKFNLKFWIQFKLCAMSFNIFIWIKFNFHGLSHWAHNYNIEWILKRKMVHFLNLSLKSNSYSNLISDFYWIINENISCTFVLKFRNYLHASLLMESLPTLPKSAPQFSL